MRGGLHGPFKHFGIEGPLHTGSHPSSLGDSKLLFFKALLQILLKYCLEYSRAQFLVASCFSCMLMMSLTALNLKYACLRMTVLYTALLHQ